MGIHLRGQLRHLKLRIHPDQLGIVPVQFLQRVKHPVHSLGRLLELIAGLQTDPVFRISFCYDPDLRDQSLDRRCIVRRHG